jgi:predicted nucleic acid-binding protein
VPALGFRNFDALHLASAEAAAADVLGTCDDQFLTMDVRNCDRIKVRVLGVTELVTEVLR